jgi:hypothetical protein
MPVVAQLVFAPAGDRWLIDDIITSDAIRDG